MLVDVDVAASEVNASSHRVRDKVYEPRFDNLRRRAWVEADKFEFLEPAQNGAALGGKVVFAAHDNVLLGTYRVLHAAGQAFERCAVKAVAVAVIAFAFVAFAGAGKGGFGVYLEPYKYGVGVGFQCQVAHGDALASSECVGVEYDADAGV